MPKGKPNSGIHPSGWTIEDRKPNGYYKDKSCIKKGCTKKIMAKGMCSLHYQRTRHTGQLDPLPPKPTPDCSVEGCERKYYGRNYCQLHWGRWYKTGDPLQGTQEQYFEKIKAKPVTCKVVCQGVRCDLKIGRGHGDGITHKGSTAREFCSTHDARWRAHGDVRADDPIAIMRSVDAKRPPCKEPDCEREARGWQGNHVYCDPHGLLFGRHGRTHRIKKSNIGKTCSNKGCDKVCESGADRFVDGMCPACYVRVTGKGNESQARRRARKANAKCDGHTTAELQQYWKDKGIDPKRCTYCEDWHTKWPNNWKTSIGDHVVPLCRGGTNLMSNLMPACGICNSKKGPKLLSEWTQPKHEKKVA
tara:strand:- start:13142 stop:14224 length:1083 start_codon:yes stop_codon:yes gene_type:complete